MLSDASEMHKNRSEKRFEEYQDQDYQDLHFCGDFNEFGRWVCIGKTSTTFWTIASMQDCPRRLWPWIYNKCAQSLDRALKVFFSIYSPSSHQQNKVYKWFAFTVVSVKFCEKSFFFHLLGTRCAVDPVFISTHRCKTVRLALSLIHYLKCISKCSFP